MPARTPEELIAALEAQCLRFYDRSPMATCANAVDETGREHCIICQAAAALTEARQELKQRDQLARLYRLEDALDHPEASETQRVLGLCNLLATTRRNQVAAEKQRDEARQERDRLAKENETLKRHAKADDVAFNSVNHIAVDAEQERDRLRAELADRDAWPAALTEARAELDREQKKRVDCAQWYEQERRRLMDRAEAAEAERDRLREAINDARQALDSLGVTPCATLQSVQRALHVNAPTAMRLLAIREAIASVNNAAFSGDSPKET